MTTRGSRQISVRASEDIHDRLDKAAGRAACTKSEWVLAAIEVQLETDEQMAFGHRSDVPKVVTEAIPKMVGKRMRLPAGRVMPGRLS